MCGIAGISWARGVAPREAAVLEKTAAALAHRGPDGTHIVRLGRADLIHTRLAIIDPEGGDQPLRAGPATLVANGEIYNDPDIRKKHSEYKYVSGSDCESALRLWEHDDASFACGLRGMYAIAIHDAQHGEITLSRDPFGIKSLYIAHFSEGIIFSSEISALLASGLLTPEVDIARQTELLQLGFTTGAETILSGIRRILPGETIRISEGQIVSSSRIRAVPAVAPDPSLTEDAALDRLDAALTDSVRVHERSDVPFGMFLSGGIDSAAVLAVMARLRKESGRSEALMAWTAAFDVPQAADESEAARALAGAAGAEHDIIRITRDDVWRHLPEIVACMDDPAADYAIIPTWFLARKASRSVRVVLSGEGGDELFAGYGRYRSAMRPWWRGGKRPWRHGIFDRTDVLKERGRHWRDGIAAAEMAALQGAHGRLAAVQAADIAEWLPNDLLLKLDRCLMAHGVEGRTPLLDPVVARVAWSLPDGMRIRDRMGKWLLRQWLARTFPAARPFAPKQGFTVPVGSWIAAEGDRLGQLVAADPMVQEIARAENVRALFRNAAARHAGHAAWTLLFYTLWHRIHVRGMKPDAGVYDMLAA
ncbi:asparagine synthase (glutamine-hydrolyzing) [Acetobacter sp. AN02]|uniref:asparagine synthase (glutamine-hydrolyzing) n=1 Tax=Acetobacter sp. AN02 TaxID=2894186 RepID=UPI0024342632|nr:asparagine synthase (glutamine-hydrolyzing) [Acetobacter sp. AN02]MDG6094816.1 asparagine synthase (glutamine-hydrolyzing) [Acetobacter sp. AN02]